MINKRTISATLAVIVVTIVALLWLSVTGYFGRLQPLGEIVASPRSADSVQERSEAQKTAQKKMGASVPVEKQILFGDLHAHTTFSFDAFNLSLPLIGGEGAHPPSDACDFARHCAALDFWSINDHAEGLTPRQWQITKDAVRQCNAIAGDPEDPDMVSFLGWEWTQIGQTPETHYGHKNVVLKHTDDDKVPARPISSREQLFPNAEDPYTWPMRLLMLAGAGAEGRQPYHDFIRFIQERSELSLCDANKSVHELPADCQESAPTPTELFGKLDEWGHPYMVIPHGTTWGFYTPPRTSWDKQLLAHKDPDRHESLIEVFSGHGNTEQYRSWRPRYLEDNGQEVCAAPTDDYLPECWRAGQIIEARCLDEGEASDICAERAAATRANFVLSKDAGHWSIPGTSVEDWLNSGQCTDCYMPAYNYRPMNSVQYGLAIRDFSDPGAEPKRFRWGMIGSSDGHTARPGTGYKEFKRRNMSDAAMGNLGPPKFLKDPEPKSTFTLMDESIAGLGPNFERFSSFFGTGGLVAVHSAGRSRDAIWSALERKEVYATSGDRILLWFDLVSDEDAIPMGSSVERSAKPKFRVRVAGAFEQKPGCPPDTLTKMPADEIESLCGGECYNPSDKRKVIDRIEVVRILPQTRPDEPVEDLIADPWRTLPCPPGSSTCAVEFEDDDFTANKRDAVYYVRAIEEASPTINAANLRCEYDENGQCIKVNPCFAGAPTSETDDCLAPAEERAWSSPIFVDWGG